MNGWVKKGILLGFRMGAMVDMSIDRTRPRFDTYDHPTTLFARTLNLVAATDDHVHDGGDALDRLREISDAGLAELRSETNPATLQH